MKVKAITAPPPLLGTNLSSQHPKNTSPYALGTKFKSIFPLPLVEGGLFFSIIFHKVVLERLLSTPRPVAIRTAHRFLLRRWRSMVVELAVSFQVVQAIRLALAALLPTLVQHHILMRALVAQKMRKTTASVR